jgi:hypothetical protein
VEVVNPKIEVGQRFYFCGEPKAYDIEKYEVREDGIVTKIVYEKISPGVGTVFEVTEISEDPDYPNIVGFQASNSCRENDSRHHNYWIDASIFEDDKWAKDRREDGPIGEERTAELLTSEVEVNFRPMDTAQRVRALMREAIEKQSTPRSDSD